MASPTYLAVDVMGGDESPHSFVHATLFFLKSHPHTSVLLYGSDTVIAAAKQNPHAKPLLSRLQFIVAEQVVAPDEKPSSALRKKQQSSMWLALHAVAQGRADAALSAGNTGALMVMARYLLGMLKGIDRPAICKRMPVRGASCYVLDLGANLTASALQLEQFALIGAALAEVEGVVPAKVGLLNIGEEHQKGTEVLREADQRLRDNTRYSYQGFVEGNAMFDGRVNVVVCDGFTGNIALKASEGLARYLIRDLKRYFGSTPWRRVLGFCARLLASGWFKRLNPADYNGALLAGLNGVVIKSHGGADQAAFSAALQMTCEQAQRKPHLLLATWLD
ncbi:phosphate acyltransferase PlsX [Marinagarivorans algicola]|uniref:phosphate acyltransferase PlsX n=1 Tax=Marinagarivorans algicola TaxID=1513270 RepID=UPI0037369334